MRSRDTNGGHCSRSAQPSALLSGGGQAVQQNPGPGERPERYRNVPAEDGAGTCWRANWLPNSRPPSRAFWCAAKIPQNARSLISVGTAMGWSMSTRCERPWPAIDLAELRYCLAFGSSVEEMADFLHRDVEDVRYQIAVEAQRAVSQRPH